MRQLFSPGDNEGHFVINCGTVAQIALAGANVSLLRFKANPHGASCHGLSGQNNGTGYKLVNLSTSVGREMQRDIQIMDPKVSRKHLVL